MAGTLRKLAGPAYIANAAANIYTPSASTILTTIKHIHFANKDSSARTFSLYIGATGGSAGGTELFKDVSIAIAGYLDWYCSLPLLSTEFLSGIASAASAIVIIVNGELSVI